MHTQRRAKFMMAGGIESLALVITLLLVLPATQPGRIATEAQPEPGDMEFLGMEEEMPGEIAVAEEAPPPSPFTGDPFEPSRPNPFQAGAGVDIEALENIITTATTYGPTWHQMPLASRMSVGMPQRGPKPEAEPAPKPEEQKFVRLSSILWTAGKPLAVYETGDGKSGNVQPGDSVDNWLVEQIGQDYALVRNTVTGECRRVPLKTQ